ncbi:hypothetical protein [Amycolatopsis sp. NPDC051371]|uniref:hypothetical protein n=1 Tax=Amycolatopsis sp. NPDC051371 TaxID=3155800 RepID=UPI003442A7CA
MSDQVLSTSDAAAATPSAAASETPGEFDLAFRLGRIDALLEQLLDKVERLADIEQEVGR